MIDGALLRLQLVRLEGAISALNIAAANHAHMKGGKSVAPRWAR